ncbi:MAG: cysteine--tRNA ligase [Oscillospiraceae bacterium]|jgi:cysteinyl-tRNA synthetase|nr:cysteine--tRNA ligase [Oscillospiraceae bacterium]
MKLYDTMSKTKEELLPNTKNKTVRIYACGPTVYNLFHVGNARPLCVFDVLRRYLKYRGYNVKYVQNFTDVDDKIIKKAAELGVPASEVSENAIEEYFTDARGLNVADADIHPKVTDNMDLIINFIKTLIDKGFAYEKGGDVYFSTEKFVEYGKLSKMPLDELRAGASERVSESELKHDPMDFALWKAAKEGEPYWESPFGQGRPGWHIECSAMAREYLGDTIDIHGGGADLIFPHHENEIAQSEAATGKMLSKIWMHNEMVNVVANDNIAKKMAKSAGNFFTVRNAAEVYGYEPIRFMLLAAHYRSKMNYSEEVIKSAQASLERLYNCKNTIKRVLEAKTDDNAGSGLSKFAENIIQTCKNRFIKVMDDDLNTADAIAVVFELTREINKALSAVETTQADITALSALFKELTGVLGLLYDNGDEDIPAEILELADRRLAARKEKNFALADQIREEITNLGFTIEETRQGAFIRRG